MYLEKLEIHGFKSFGDAVKLTIPQGITAVIGPNGSGKSNVADAIRWVLGEQSAKTLRGTKMEDIIFAGTERRKSLGYAEVSMHIKNDDRKLPIDYADVMIKRRVYRSGESEYFINNSICRLKDIQELFMDTGVGKEGYSIIGQGQIDKVLSSKPEDRRSLFEEAAGIYKYKVRRTEAERKLDKERDNLLRIHDIMVEIESRLEPLEKEAHKTKSYLLLKDHLKEVEINVFIREIDKINQELQNIESNLLNLETEISDNKLKREETIKLQQQCKTKREKLYVDVQATYKWISDLEKEEQQKKADIKLNEERISSINNLLNQIEKDTKKQIDFRAMIQNDLQVLQAKKRGLDLDLATKESILEKLQNDFESKHLKLQQIEQDIQKSKQEQYTKMRQKDLLEADIKNKDEFEEEVAYKRVQLQEQIARMNTEVAHQEVDLKVKIKKMDALKEQLKITNKTIEEQNQLKMELQQKLVSTKNEVEEIRQEMIQTERQLNWLVQIKNDFEGYFQSVKQVLTLKQKEEHRWTGILGVTADLVTVPEKYELAMVTALGGAMQHIVTQTEQDAKVMIGVMKQRGIGKVTFLPLDTLQAYSLGKELDSIRKEDGFLGLGSELITYDQKYVPVVNYLLGRILIVDNIHNGSKLAKKYKYKYKIVTLEGEVFNAGGSLSGGSVKNNKNNIFARTRELKVLEEKQVVLKDAYREKQVLLEGMLKDEQQLLMLWDTLNDTLDSLENDEKTLFITMNQAMTQLEVTKKSQLQMVEERCRLEELSEKSKEDKESIYAAITDLKSDLKVDEREIETLEAALTLMRDEHEVIRTAVTEKKIAQSQVVQTIEHTKEQIEIAKKNIENNQEQHTSIVLRQKELDEDKQKLEMVIQKLKQDIETIEAKIVQAHGKKDTYETDKLSLETEEEEVEETLAVLTDRSEKLKEEQFRLLHKQEVLKTDEQKQGDTIWEQYELTYTHCLAFKTEAGSLSDMKKEVDGMRAKIKAIGHVNVNALAEFEETKTRFDFLKTQCEDIEKAEASLVELIETLTKQMYEIFREQFTAIATNFSQVFQELFGGGVAFLQLVDEENILESGIEIIAKPPGKKLQNMTLLSGGERTLTAIALLFGILKLKPSPFCVLDEIEAALDDANVLRFSEYLNSLSQDTQFVVITHRKGTMERADTLYGVTMQERGVSTVLSIKLEEATQYLDKKTS